MPTIITVGQRVVRTVSQPVSRTRYVANGPKGADGGKLMAEFLSSTLDPRVWQLSFAPTNQVSIFDDVPMRLGYDFTISGQTVTFLLIDPVAPYAIYQH